MKLQYTLLALALATFAAPAFAEGDDAVIGSETYLFNGVIVSGDPTVDGRIRVNAESKAIVDQDQTTDGNWSLGDGDNSAGASDDAMSAAEGNMGLNIAAGVGNAQHNGLSIAVASCGTCN